MKNSIDLGLAILSATTPPGIRRTAEEIAAYCGCNRSYIYQVEERAIHKLRKRLAMRRDPELLELLQSLNHHV